MDILEKIRKDHTKARKLIQEITELDSHDEDVKKLIIFDQLKNELLAHAHSEDETLYKEMKKSNIDELNNKAEHSEKEHNEIEDLIERVSTARADNEDWTFKFNLLKERLEHHMKEEEDEVFKVVNDNLGESMKNYIGDEMQDQKQEDLSKSVKA